MELLETQDPVRRELIEKSDRHRQALQTEMKAISQKTEQTLKNALIIGGSLALAYFITRQLVSDKTKKVKVQALPKAKAIAQQTEVLTEPHEATLIAKVGTQILNQATFFLLQLAKDKLLEYLASRKQLEETGEKNSF